MGIILQDLRLVRDKFTHVSRGFAFVHFHSVCPTFSMLINSVGSVLIFCMYSLESLLALRDLFLCPVEFLYGKRRRFSLSSCQ